MTVGQRIRDRRKALGYTQKQLGELCGMADSAIRKYESGRITPKHQTLKKIANALEISEWSLTGVDFESYEDGTVAAIVDLDIIDKNVAHKLTSLSNPEGLQVGLTFESEEEKRSFEYFLEKGVTPPEFTTRLLTAFYKLNFPMQQILIKNAENMVQHASLMSDLEQVVQVSESDCEE